MAEREIRTAPRASVNRSFAARSDWFGKRLIFLPYGIQLGVLKHFPPIALARFVAGLGGLPVARILIGGAISLVGFTYFGPTEQPKRNRNPKQEKRERDPTTCVPRPPIGISGYCLATIIVSCETDGSDAATRTFSPSVNESGGSMTTDSSPLSPAMTSILAPKSRPGVMDFSAIVFPSFTVATLHSRGFEDRCINRQRERRHGCRQREVNLGITAWFEFACRIVDIDLNEQCARGRIDSARNPERRSPQTCGLETR